MNCATADFADITSGLFSRIFRLNEGARDGDAVYAGLHQRLNIFKPDAADGKDGNLYAGLPALPDKGAVSFQSQDGA